MFTPEYNLYPVEAIANRILHEAQERGVSVTNLQMQKFVYFAQGFALAQLGHPLFDEDFEAWTYGPVVPRLYRLLKHYEAKPIGPLPTSSVVAEGSKAARVICEMMDKLGKLSSTQLVRLSHREDSPWTATWKEGKGRCDVIPLWQMALYFTSLLGPLSDV